MNIVKEWFEEACKELRVHNIRYEEFVIYKGIRVSKRAGIFNNGVVSKYLERPPYSIVDANRNGGHPQLSAENLTILKLNGFIKGCDIIGYNRDLKNIRKLNDKAVLLYEKRRVFKDRLAKNKMFKIESPEGVLPHNERLNKKRVRNINVNIKNILDQMFLHKIRVEQFKTKYNKK